MNVRLEDARNTNAAPPRPRWWERVARAFVVETELADGSRVPLPVDPSGMLMFWPSSSDLMIGSTPVFVGPFDPVDREIDAPKRGR